MTAASQKPKILIIKQPNGALLMLQRLLIHAGCEVSTAQNGDEGIKLLGEETFNLIVLDVDLPEMSGLEVCQNLKNDPRLGSTPIVLISEQFSEKNWLRGLELGAADYIEKPFDHVAFIRRLLFHVKVIRANP